MKRNPPPSPAQWGLANKYVRAIKNVEKRAYAERILEAYRKGANTSDVDRSGLSYMGAQAVRIQLIEILGDPPEDFYENKSKWPTEDDERKNPAKKVPFSRTALSTWFERDRAHVALTDTKNDKILIEWWDEDVAQAIEDGFLDSRNYHESAYEYAKHLGIIA